MKLKLSACLMYVFNPEPIVFQIKNIGMNPMKLAVKQFNFVILKITGNTFCGPNGMPNPPHNLNSKK